MTLKSILLLEKIHVTSEDHTVSNSLFISKQPVLDRDNSIQDYIFYYAPYEQTQQLNHTRSFLEALFQTGIKELSGGRRAFIKINREMLSNPSIFTFTNEQLIFAIDDAEPIDETMIARVNELKALNFTFALFHTSDKEDLISELTPLLPLVQYFIVDTSAVDLEAFQTVLPELRDYRLTMIASNIADEKTQQAFSTLGIQLFSGHYYLDEQLDDEKEIDKGYQETLALLNILQTSKAIDEIATEFATYPNITLKLLRYLNSPAFMLKHTIKSIRHALLLIGRKDLRRWLLLLAFTQTDDGSPANNPLLYTANTRMAIMRFLVNRLTYATKELSDEAPFVAVLSMLQPLMGVSYDKIFDSINLDEEIKSAITTYHGTLGKLLELSIATEQLDQQRVTGLLEELGLDQEAFEQALLESYKEQ